MTTAVASHASMSAVAASRASRAGITAASTSRLTIASSPSIVDAGGFDRLGGGGTASRAVRASARSGSAPSDSKIRAASFRYAAARERGPGGGRQSAQFEVTQAGLVLLAEQIEHADALPEIVVRVGHAACGGVKPAAKPEELAPGAAHRSWLNPIGDRVEVFLRALSQARMRAMLRRRPARPAERRREAPPARARCPTRATPRARDRRDAGPAGRRARCRDH